MRGRSHGNAQSWINGRRMALALKRGEAQAGWPRKGDQVRPAGARWQRAAVKGGGKPGWQKAGKDDEREKDDDDDDGQRENEEAGGAVLPLDLNSDWTMR